MTTPIRKATAAPAPAVRADSGIRSITSIVASPVQTPSPIPSPAQATSYPAMPSSTRGSDPPLPMNTSIATMGLPVNSLVLPLPAHPIPPDKPTLPTSDPLLQLSGTATAAIVSVGCFITVICLGTLFLIWRAKKRRSQKIAADKKPPPDEQVTDFNIIPQHAPINKRTPFPNRPRANSKRATWISYVDTSPQGPTVLLRSPPTPLTTGLDIWEPLEGLSDRLRLSTDTCMVLDPFMLQPDAPLPQPLASKNQSFLNSTV